MEYQVLALKWRPQNFDQVIGQDHITQALKMQLLLIDCLMHLHLVALEE